MTTFVDNPLSDHMLDIEIRSDAGTSKGQQALLKALFNDGVDIPKALRYRCRVAEDVKATIGPGINADGEVYRPNRVASPQFGKTKDGQAYLSFGLIRESDQLRLSFKWTGPDVPMQMQEIAVRHDEGRKTPRRVISLDFGAAQVWESHKNSPLRPRGRHDISPVTGEPYQRKRLDGRRPAAQKFNRIGRCDLEAKRSSTE